MCGRFDLHTPPPLIAQRWFGNAINVEEAQARYNVPPGIDILMVREQDGGIRFDKAHWGYRPYWAGEDAPQPINAKAETVATSRFFQTAFRHKRCLIPANGWFEWAQRSGGKQPHYITLLDAAAQDILLFAGIWETSPDGGLCTAILTEPAAPKLAHIHSRQPVVLNPACRYEWLSREVTERHQIKSAAQRLDPQGLVSWPVTPAMNRPDFDGPEAIEPIKEQ